MTKRMLTLTAALLCAGTTTLAQNSGSAVAKPAPVTQPQADPVPLNVGDKAPELKVAKFVKGEPITGFEKGKTYVVEGWATWCGPCKQSIPHLTELQKEYKDKVTFVGVSVWERDQSKVEPFVKEMGDTMAYTVAMDDVPEGKTGNDGRIARTWLQAAGQNGIPAAFIVNGDGRVAWIGHPMEIEEPLKAVVDGTWDIKKAADDFQKEIGAQRAMTDFQKAVKAKNWDAASKAAPALIATGDPQMCNMVAWSMVDPKGGWEKPDLALALKAANAADDATNHSDGAIIDTLARVYFLKGDIKKAVELETKAVEVTDDAQMKPDLQATLKEYQDALAKQPH